MKHSSLSVVTASLLALFSAAPAHADYPAANDRAFFVEGGRPTLAPFGYIEYCARNPLQCAPSEATHIDLDVETVIRLDDVNNFYNRTIVPENESVDNWRGADGSGDCEDYALAKRAELIALGLAPGALRMAAARTRRGEAHAVLVVRTNQGDLVLDNLTDAIVPYPHSKLKWSKIASEEDPRLWLAISSN